MVFQTSCTSSDSGNSYTRIANIRPYSSVVKHTHSH